MAHCVREEGIPSFKTFMAYKGAIGGDDGELIQIMKTAKSLGALKLQHIAKTVMCPAPKCKINCLAKVKIHPKYHAQSRPSIVEGEATHRAVILAKMVGVPHLCGA